MENKVRKLLEINLNSTSDYIDYLICRNIYETVDWQLFVDRITAKDTEAEKKEVVKKFIERLHTEADILNNKPVTNEADYINNKQMFTKYSQLIAKLSCYIK